MQSQLKIWWLLMMIMSYHAVEDRSSRNSKSKVSVGQVWHLVFAICYSLDLIYLLCYLSCFQYSVWFTDQDRCISSLPLSPSPDTCLVVRYYYVHVLAYILIHMFVCRIHPAHLPASIRSKTNRWTDGNSNRLGKCRILWWVYIFLQL